jgi:UDP-N-acetylmuramate--alanine ligase
LVANEDDENVVKIAKRAKCKVIYYSSSESASRRRSREVVTEKFSTRASLKASAGQASSNHKQFLKLQVPGKHNISNALAVLAVARILKIPDKITYEALSQFKGTWRRMEYRGVVNGAKIYDDYGHHPTEIKATLQGAKQLLKKENHRLWCVFQPHQYQRTYKLFNQFVGAFNDADRVILLPIYSVAGREKGDIKKKVSSKKLVNAMHKLFSQRSREIIYANSFQDARNCLKRGLKKDDICVVMGAGDIYKLTELLMKGDKVK